MSGEHRGSPAGGRSHEFETSGPLEIVVEAAHGRVVVVATEQTRARVEVRPSRPTRAGDVALVGDTEVALDHDRLTVHVPRRSSFLGRPDTVEVRLEVPRGSRLEARSDHGRLELRGELEPCLLVARYGSVRAESVEEAEVESPYGTVEIALVTGRLTGSVGHGELRIGAVGGPSRLRGSHGTIRLGEVAGPLDVATSGEVTIGRTGGDVDVRTAHGVVTVEEATGGRLRLSSTYADVSVGVGPGVGVWLDAQTRYGTLRNELVADPGAAETAGSVELHLRSQYADVRVHRATGDHDSSGAPRPTWR